MREENCFELRWKNHLSTVVGVLDTLLKSETFVDVTLASEGKWLRAHRLVLCACSEYFEELLTFQPDKNAIFYLKDVPFSHLEALIQFMYRGEVNIVQTELQNFISTANSLRIRGLSDICHETQLLASQTLEKLTESSLNQINAASPTSETTQSLSATSSCRPATKKSARRLKYYGSKLSNDVVTPTVCKSTSQTSRIPTDHPASTDSTALAGRETSASQTQSNHPVTATVELVAVNSVSSNLGHILVAPGKGRDNVEELLCNEAIPKIEMEEIDLDTVNFDNIVAGSEEEWSEMEGQEHSQEEWTGLETENSSRSDAPVCGKESGSESHVENPASSDLNSTGTFSVRFACPQCPRSYKNLRDLHSHQRYECQNVVRQFSCTMCDYKGKRMYHLGRHLKRVHKAKT